MLHRTLTTSLTAASHARGLLAEVTCTVEAGARWMRGFGPEHVTLPTVENLMTNKLPNAPVMLVHGLGANKSYFVDLERALTRAGYTVYCVNYNWFGTDLAACGAHVAADATRFLTTVGADRIHIVGHSLGGIVVRWALTHTDLADYTDTVVTLGSPHQGTRLAHLAPGHLPLMGTLLAQLRTDAAVLDDLADPGDLPHLRMVAVGGGLDWVVPAKRALLPTRPNVTNVVVATTGHIAMATHPTVIAGILEMLRATDPTVATTAA